MFDRVGRVRVAWSERVWPDAGPEVPDERPGAWAQHAADLGQAGRRVGPVVQRQGADHEVEGAVGERQRGRVADQERRPTLATRARSTMAGSRSTPVTSRLWPASRFDRWPGPHPTSSARAPSGAAAPASAAMPAKNGPSSRLSAS